MPLGPEALYLGFLGLPALHALWSAYAVARGLAAVKPLPKDPPAGSSAGRSTAPRESWPRLSVIIPACNEAATLEDAMRAKLASDYPNLEVVLVDDRSTDGTSEIVDRLAAVDSRVRAVHLRELPQGWLGKVHALQRGTEAATGEWLLYSDADVHLSSSVLRRAIAFAEAGELDFLVATPNLWSSTFALDVVLATFMRTLLVAARAWQIGDPKSRASAGAGLFNLCRRAAFDRTKGFEWLRLEITDDISFGQMMKHSGARCGLFKGDEDVGLYFYRSLGELMRGLEKNGYAVLGQLRPMRILVAAIVVFYLEMGPMIALAFPSTAARVLGAAILTCTAATQAIVARSGQRPILSALVPCVGWLLLLAFMLRSAVLAHWRGGILWRGTLYPLEDLRRGQRFRFT